MNLMASMSQVLGEPHIHHVVVAVPGKFIEDFEGVEVATQALLARIEKSQTGLLRGRGLKLVSLESITEPPVVSVGEKP